MSWLYFKRDKLWFLRLDSKYSLCDMKIGTLMKEMEASITLLWSDVTDKRIYNAAVEQILKNSDWRI